MRQSARACVVAIADAELVSEAALVGEVPVLSAIREAEGGRRLAPPRAVAPRVGPRLPLRDSHKKPGNIGAEIQVDIFMTRAVMTLL
jgi:hypothetical protein